MLHRRSARPLLALLWAVASAVACSGGGERAIRIERVAPPADPSCGAPLDARTLRITALGDFAASEATARTVAVEAGAFSLEGFPPATNSLAVEVLGTSGAVRAIGRTPLFDPAELEDGASIPVFMAPPGGTCPTGPPERARERPLLARAGAGALVAGGQGEDGEPVHLVELYDPATGQFVRLGQPLYGVELAAGLAGASMTEMAGGRVVIAGGGATAFQVYDPDAGGFGEPRFLREARAHHAAVALDDDRLLLAGGCARVDGAACEAGSELASSSILSLSTGAIGSGPGLARLRVAGSALLEPDGRVLLVGGVDASGAPVTEAERIDPHRARASELVDGTGHALALLAAGSALTGFAPAGAAPDAIGSVVPSGSDRASRIAVGPARAGPIAVALEYGPVLVVGGAGDEDDAGLVVAGLGQLQRVTGPLGELTGHAAVRLDDGSALVVGGRRAGALSGAAWIVRPDLTGPFTSGLSVTFATDDASLALVPRDPARGLVTPASAERPAHFLLRSSGVGASGAATEWAVLAGPRFRSVRMEARVAALGGGAGALLWFRGPADHAMVALVPGERARLLLVESGVAGPAAGCSGEEIDPADLEPLDSGASQSLTITASSGELAALVGGREVLRCRVDPPAAGLVGLAPLGAAAELRIDLVSAVRP